MTTRLATCVLGPALACGVVGAADTFLFVDSGQRLGDSTNFSVALGDLDGDGDLDAMVANGGPNIVWTNDGTGTFTNSGQELGDSYSTSVALGDLDGDGDLDAVVANYGANTVWINDGTGTFTNSGQALGNNWSWSVALGDLDGDGDLDAVVANGYYPSKPNTVWTNDGNGTFTNSGQALGDSTSRSVALGDLDGDGDLDAMVANSGDQPNTVWTNDGNATFTNSGQALGSSDSLSVALGDLDGDGDLDAMVANSGEPNTVWTNDGNGTFTNSEQELGDSSRSVALGDLDGDGDLDAMVANGGPDTVWINDGSGTFTNSGQALGDSSSTSVALGDLDGDGDLDAMVANRSGPNTVWFNQALITVCPDGRCQFTDLESALSVAEAGDVIEIAAGQYPIPTTLTVSGPVTIRGQVDQDGVPTTILSGTPGIRFMTLYPTAAGGPVLESLEFRSGGGIQTAGQFGVELPATFLENCTFRDNQSTYGGAIEVGGRLQASNCRFIDNHADKDGGAITYGGSDTVTTAPLHLIDCSFTGNTADDDGGAVEFYKGGFIIEGCTFAHNLAVNDGGAIIGNELNTPSALRSCTFEFNRCTGAVGIGGAAYLVNFSESSFGGSIQIDACRFEGNEATYAGGAILTSDAAMTITNGEFVGNRSALGGALGVSDEYGLISPTLTECLFVENFADLGGDGYLQLAARFSNCDFRESTAAVGPALFIEGSLSCGIGNCCIEDCVFQNSTASELNPLISASDPGAYRICGSAFCGMNENTTINQAGVIGQDNAYDADCQCEGELTGDLTVDGADLTILLSAWGETCTPKCPGDLDGSGVVNGQDLARLLANWGSCL